MDKNIDKFELMIAAFNEKFFFKEFTYSTCKFFHQKQTFQAADCIISLDEILLIFQIKNRNFSVIKSAEDERKWFYNKVLKHAKNQIKDTLNYLGNKDFSVNLKNHRGHSFALTATPSSVQKIILYQASHLLPDDIRKIKYYDSDEVGIIHVFEADDHYNVVKTLITPGEISEYLIFREKLIDKCSSTINDFDEKSLIGQYISGRHEAYPSHDFHQDFELIYQNLDEWDMSWLIHIFEEKITFKNNVTPELGYYHIIKEIAKLQRHELLEFKKRIQLTINASKENKKISHWRMTVPRLNCGFIFLPLTQEDIGKELLILEAFTRLHKYDQRIDKCIGVTILLESNGLFSIKWSFLNDPWVEDLETAEFLKNNPLDKVELKVFTRYEFLNN